MCIVRMVLCCCNYSIIKMHIYLYYLRIIEKCCSKLPYPIRPSEIQDGVNNH